MYFVAEKTTTYLLIRKLRKSCQMHCMASMVCINWNINLCNKMVW